MFFCHYYFLCILVHAVSLCFLCISISAIFSLPLCFHSTILFYVSGIHLRFSLSAVSSSVSVSACTHACTQAHTHTSPPLLLIVVWLQPPVWKGLAGSSSNRSLANTVTNLHLLLQLKHCLTQVGRCCRRTTARRLPGVLCPSCLLVHLSNSSSVWGGERLLVLRDPFCVHLYALHTQRLFFSLLWTSVLQGLCICLWTSSSSQRCPSAAGGSFFKVLNTVCLWGLENPSLSAKHLFIKSSYQIDS